MKKLMLSLAICLSINSGCKNDESSTFSIRAAKIENTHYFPRTYNYDKRYIIIIKNDDKRYGILCPEETWSELEIGQIIDAKCVESYGEYFLCDVNEWSKNASVESQDDNLQTGKNSKRD